MATVQLEDRPHVTAIIIDENTLEVTGVQFVRKRDDDEVLLQPTNGAIAPRLRCSGCGFERSYTFWYKRLHFQERQLNFCPGCGHPILGVIGHG